MFTSGAQIGMVLIAQIHRTIHQVHREVLTVFAKGAIGYILQEVVVCHFEGMEFQLKGIMALVMMLSLMVHVSFQALMG